MVVMPTKGDNDEERFNRIAALMEEYRVKHEDLVAYIDAVRDRMRADGQRVRSRASAARAAVKRARNVR
jgi:hypothetical protein